MNRTIAVLALALLAGCGGGDDAKKSSKKGPYPVSRPAPEAQPSSGGGTGMPTAAETHRGNVGSEPVKPPPSQPAPDARPHLAGKTGVDPGDVPPEIVLSDTAGNVFMLSSFRGRNPVLLVFGATW